MLKTILLSTLAATAIACGNSGPDSVGDPTGNAGGAGGGGIVLTTGTGGSNGGGAANGSGKPGELKFIIRDFKFYDANDKKTNPDFENVPAAAGNQYGPWDDSDIVTDTLGDDHLPVYKNKGSTTLTTHGEDSFKQWFHNTDGTNYTQTIPVTLTKNSQGVYEYNCKDSGELNKDGMFFPIDDGTKYATPFGNQTGKDSANRSHNFSFTLEIHTVFTYEGGEQFKFTGDDDVFVYINNKRVINLGGIHGTLTQTVEIDKLGLTVGTTYPLDFFYAERHMVASDLYITTGLELQNNGTIPIL
jgi:fibro-slime domain-containing protein